MIDVEMPDGTVIEGVPDGITQTELMRRYGKMQNNEKTGFTKDVLKSAGTGLARGAIGLVTAPVDLGAMAGGYLANKGMKEIYGEGYQEQDVPSLSNYIYEKLGLNYSPQSTVGNVLQSAGELAPALHAFPTKATQALTSIPRVVKTGKMALGGAVGGEIGKEMTDSPIGEIAGTLLGLSPKTTIDVASKIASYPIKGAISGGTKALSAINKAVVEPTTQGISRAITQASLPKAARGLSDAESLYVKSLVDEGMSIDDALNSLRPSAEMGATPSVAVTASVPQMQTQGYLMAKGSAGSKVAAKAVQNITEEQIPRLNERLIKEAVGTTPKTAEEYGRVASTLAKQSIDSKRTILAKRAAPYYQQSVGVDKSLDISNPLMKRVLENPLATKALEEYRKDPYTLTNVLKELERLGVNASEIEKLPYNSTISLHGARTYLRQLSDAAFSAGERQKGAAIKSALGDIDAAIESQFPSYKTARRIYSEDAGALKALIDSPIGQMASFAEGDYSKIANQFMQKDPAYIKKTLFNMGKSGVNENKMRQSIAGAFLKRQLEEARNNGLRFGDAVFKNAGNRARLEALLGKDKVLKMQKVNDVIDSLVSTKSIPQQSITSAAQSIKEGVSLPSDKAGLLAMLKNRISPNLFDLVQKNPEQAARFNELMFTDEGFKLLEKLSANKKVTFSEMESVLKSLSRKVQ